MNAPTSPARSRTITATASGGNMPVPDMTAVITVDGEGGRVAAVAAIEAADAVDHGAERLVAKNDERESRNALLFC